jgi:hypothetical protein
MISAKVVCDSISPEGVRLTTFEVEFHRFVLAEVNTHRVFSRNYQSSRAVPIEKMIQQVETDPAMPVEWGKNQSGMQAKELLKPHLVSGSKMEWKIAARSAASSAKALNKIGVHKQIVNRLLEPFIWTKGVITTTEDGFDGFFELRLHEAAQPEIRELAKAMKMAYDDSIPAQLCIGEWHLPYAEENLELRDAIKVSISCTAQVSYRTLDQSVEKATRIYDRLNLPSNGDWPDDPPHFSPAEHCAVCVEPIKYKYHSKSNIGGNFQTHDWYQFRKILEQGIESIYIGEAE